MNRTITFAVALTVGAAITLIAATEQDHVQWMKTIQKASGSLKKGVEAKDADAKDARTLASSFKTIGAFYSDRNMADAVKVSNDAEAAAGDLEAALTAKDFEKAAVSLKAVMGSCMGCHKVHREKLEDGTYKIK